jgi:putative Ca2+/H+ antiporter (TMEM165/GDT1 family)
MKIDFHLSVFLVAFIAGFSAELPCLVRTAAIATRYGSPLSVCLGTLLGNAVLLLPVFFGAEWLHRHLPEQPVRIICGLILTLMGLLVLFHRHHH